MADRRRIFIHSAAAILLVSGAAAVMRMPTAAADPAATTVRSCHSEDVARERRCYEIALRRQLDQGGARAALATLDRLAAIDDDVRRDGHNYAHAIGIAALRSPGEVGRVFATCSPAWQSGCYHGVIQSYFLATRRLGRPIDTASLDALCADYRGSGGDRWLLFQCTHGLGHGLTMFQAHDLRRALSSCDLLSRPGEQESCYGGAFMENIVHVTQPHQMAAMSDMPAEHGHHGVPKGGEQAWRPLDPNDLHYPCSILPRKYLNACYTNQSSAMLYFTRQDIGRTAAECRRAPESVRRTCFVSLGRDVSTIGRNPVEMARLCDAAGAEFQPVCNEGVAESIVNMNADPAAGIAYCRAVPAWQSKTACYSIVGRQATGLVNGEVRREQACREAEPAFRAACMGDARPPIEAVVTATRSSR